MLIPTNIQIDAILTGKIWNLVYQYCDGAWGSLDKLWTVRFEEIVDEAKRRGLECFILAKPNSDSYWLKKTDSSYFVRYTERGKEMYSKEFDSLESAFLYWLENELQLHQLPINKL